VIDSVGSEHNEYVFAHRGRAIETINNTR